MCTSTDTYWFTDYELSSCLKLVKASLSMIYIVFTALTCPRNSSKTDVSRRKYATENAVNTRANAVQLLVLLTEKDESSSKSVKVLRISSCCGGGGSKAGYPLLLCLVIFFRRQMPPYSFAFFCCPFCPKAWLKRKWKVCYRERERDCATQTNGHNERCHW